MTTRAREFELRGKDIPKKQGDTDTTSPFSTTGQHDDYRADALPLSAKEHL